MRLPIDGSRTARANRLEVESGDGNHADCGCRVPRLIRVSHVVGFDVGLPDGDIQLFGQFHAGLS